MCVLSRNIKYVHASVYLIKLAQKFFIEVIMVICMKIHSLDYGYNNNVIQFLLATFIPCFIYMFDTYPFIEPLAQVGLCHVRMIIQGWSGFSCLCN